MPGRALFDLFNAQLNGRLPEILAKLDGDGLSDQAIADVIFERYGQRFDRTTIARWVKKVAA